MTTTPAKTPKEAGARTASATQDTGRKREHVVTAGSGATVLGTVAKPVGATGDGGSKAAMQSQATAGLELILDLEAKFRDATTPEELVYLAANDLRRLAGSRQTFVIRINGRGKPRVIGVSSIAVVDRDAPLIRWVGRLVSNLANEKGLGEAVAFSLPAYTDAEDAEEMRTYPFANMLWQPVALADGTVFAGLLQARERPFASPDRKVTERLSKTLSHAWRALVGDRRLRPGIARRRLLLPVAALTLAAMALIPVPMTTIAPAHIAARDPFVIAAPLDGVIKTIAHAPNTTVVEGDDLFRFDDTTLRNRMALAEREVGVATATYHKLRQSAFADEAARYQLAVARADEELKRAELTYAQELLSKTRVMAPVSGLLLYSDKSELEGRPVAAGERIMEIADPRSVEIEIDLPVSDAIVINEGAQVRLFLDADPLNALNARIVKASYQAEPLPSGVLVYKLRASFRNDLEQKPRIGARGTAQVYGETTSLGFFLLRRPISALRQQFGI